jgi:luciferase-type oxidoreductase
MLFKNSRLTIGVVLPMQERERHDIDFGLQLELARRADELGFSAIWVRDVPLNSPTYPDPVGHSDPWVLLGALAASTQSIALATGAIVLPLRHPLHVAKAALSMDILSSGRFVLGLGSGDRPSEFAAFDRNVDDRRELFRSHWAALEPMRLTAMSARRQVRTSSISVRAAGVAFHWSPWVRPRNHSNGSPGTPAPG